MRSRGTILASLFVSIMILAVAAPACIVRCVGSACHSTAGVAEVPPCHDRGTEQGTPLQTHCPNLVVTAVAGSFAATNTWVAQQDVLFDFPEIAAFPFTSRLCGIAPHSTAPPGPSGLELSVVFRI